MGMAAAAASALRNKKLTPSVTKAIKASPAGMFPAAAAKAGITMGSKLGQAITKSGAGKLPEQIKNISKYNDNLKAIAKSGQPSGPSFTPPSNRITDMRYRGPVKENAKASELRARIEAERQRSTGYQANKPAQVKKPKPRVK